MGEGSSGPLPLRLREKKDLDGEDPIRTFVLGKRVLVPLLRHTRLQPTVNPFSSFESVRPHLRRTSVTPVVSGPRWCLVGSAPFWVPVVSGRELVSLGPSGVRSGYGSLDPGVSGRECGNLDPGGIRSVGGDPHLGSLAFVFRCVFVCVHTSAVALSVNGFSPLLGLQSVEHLSICFCQIGALSYNKVVTFPYFRIAYTVVST